MSWLRSLRPRCGLTYRDRVSAPERTCLLPLFHKGPHRGPLTKLVKSGG